MGKCGDRHCQCGEYGPWPSNTSVKSPAVEAFGKGVQIYTCKAAGTDYAWTLKAPEATLSDVKGKLIGKHFAGPTWQASDGSTVVGEPLNVSPSPNAGAIPWIVLHAKSHEGDGVMATVDYVVRTRTEGGVAPSTGCNAGAYRCRGTRALQRNLSVLPALNTSMHPRLDSGTRAFATVHPPLLLCLKDEGRRDKVFAKFV
jgi:hypothetical protein